MSPQRANQGLLGTRWSFGVRVTPAGTKTFTFFYRLGGRKKRLSLGEYRSVTLADARAMAHVARGTRQG